MAEVAMPASFDQADRSDAYLRLDDAVLALAPIRGAGGRLT
jgi:hypothetical protein